MNGQVIMDGHHSLEHCALATERVLSALYHEVETPLPSNIPHDHMILRVDLVGSHARWKRPCLQTAHMTI
jgi:hypothetical protein